jgi:hypothetical protein
MRLVVSSCATGVGVPLCPLAIGFLDDRLLTIHLPIACPYTLHAYG